MFIHIKNYVASIFLALIFLSVAPNNAYAHGEKALEPFIRMRTIQWYDVQWTQASLKVNDEVVVTGYLL